MNRNGVAREWRLFAGCLVGTFILATLADKLDVGWPGHVANATLVIYAIVQLVRSIIWAIKTARAAVVREAVDRYLEKAHR